jgi:hypothetical protein
MRGPEPGAIVAIATRLFCENARLIIRMRGILKIFSEKLRLFLINLADFQRLRGF